MTGAKPILSSEGRLVAVAVCVLLLALAGGGGCMRAVEERCQDCQIFEHNTQS